MRIQLYTDMLQDIMHPSYRYLDYFTQEDPRYIILFREIFLCSRDPINEGQIIMYEAKLVDINQMLAVLLRFVPSMPLLFINMLDFILRTG